MIVPTMRIEALVAVAPQVAVCSTITVVATEEAFQLNCNAIPYPSTSATVLLAAVMMREGSHVPFRLCTNYSLADGSMATEAVVPEINWTSWGTSMS